MLAMEQTEGSRTHKGHIFVRKGTGIKKGELSKLRGKRIAFGDPYSTIATIYFKAEMVKASITKRDFGPESLHEFDQHGQIPMVAEGAFYAGASNVKHINKFRFENLEPIVTFDEVPNHPWVARPGLEEIIKFEDLQVCLLNFNQEGPLKQFRFNPASPEEYDVVEEALNKSKEFDKN